jgi:glycosyltransferase involved in cell wall biosynthesis
MIRFSLLHPSRMRLALAERAVVEWSENASGRHAYEYILSVDDDDDVEGYRDLARRRGTRIVVHRNRSVVDAVNRAAAAAAGDVFVVVSDDFGCPPRWDEALGEVIGERQDVAVLVHDGGEGRIMTLPVVGRELYEDLGFVYYPEYFSVLCDDDLTEAARLRGKLIDARHLVFPHRHWSSGASPFDATYARENSGRAWRIGWRTLAKRRAGEFGLRRRSFLLRAEEMRIDALYRVRALGGRARSAVRLLQRRFSG